MTTATAAPEKRHHEPPSDGTYILIALALACLTAIEVGVYYLKSGTSTLVVLLFLMALKFGMVVAFFMHLRFDSPVLRRIFIGGLTLAGAVYTIVFFIFGVFHV
jgi:cytochrome c oxidase subunit 4